jgi:nucleoside phosphorylase
VTIAILTALPKEQVAMQVMLDDAVPYSTPGNAPGEYWLGTVPSKEGGEHVVVLGRSMVGENLAAANATILLERFPHVEQVIMVGIAGAVPDSSTQEADVRLGDIVVCSGEGVVQYDFEKEVLKDGVLSSEARTPPRPASARLTFADGELRAGALLNRRPWEEHFARAGGYAWGRRPRDPDILHHHERPSEQIERLPDAGGRVAGLPRIFTGKIASANKLLKNAKRREQLRVRFGVKAVEMEASGIADASWLQTVGYFVVRGTCDYCDEHKNDAWQEYAAMIAAAYTRALLEMTRSAGPPDGTSAKTTENADPIFAIPQVIRGSVVAAVAEMAESSGQLVAALVDLVKAEEASQNVQFDAAWPSDRPWSQSVLEALATTLSSYGISLKPAEVLLAVALPYFSSCVHKAWIQATFGASRDKASLNEAYRQLLAASHAVEPLLDKDLPEPSIRLVVRWAMLRLMSEQRGAWPDALFQKLSPEGPLARWLAADATVSTLLRVVGGNVAQFDALPDVGLLRFFDHRLEVRWKLIACVLTLAELRVMGTHLLSAEIIEHVAQLPGVQEAVDRQFRKISVENDTGDSWVIRATCEEPVLDYAITEIARQLDTELRNRRRTLSDHLSTVTRGRGFPSVRSDPQPSLVDGRPRYTTPHVTFAMAPEHTRRLFMGSDLWGDPSYAFRELFQNALDACRYRAARSQFVGAPYAPQIRLFHGKAADGREFVECEDNGVGMDRDIVASCFAMAGRRFINTEEFRREHEQWRERRINVHTNSQFGIGVFSYFLAADELEVETARLGRACEAPKRRLLLRVPTAAAFFRIVALSDEEARAMQRERAEARADTPAGYLDAGTRVRLWLRRGTDTPVEGFKARVSCVDAIREHVWFSEVAVDVRDYRGQRYQIEANGLAPWLSQTVEATGLNSRFWWILGDLSDRPDGSQGQEAVATFRSRKRGNDGGPGRYSNPGRILVDGISTDLTTPGFILNLAGEHTPKLSLDRRKIRTDLRSQLEQLVEQALPFLPSDVTQSFLQDLWHWDPRACHKATRIVSARQTGWLRARSYLTRMEDAPPERARESFMPEVTIDLDSFTDTRDFRKTLLSLSELARRSPEAREWSPIELEARGVAPEFRGYLRNIPNGIWQAWRRFELGVPEASALLYGSSGRNPLALPAFVSWLTGETAVECSKRLVRLRELLDLRWNPPAHIPDVVLSDYDAWLLGRGQISTSWIGPKIKTRDVLLFCSNAGRTLTAAIDEYAEISARLGIDMDVDRVEMPRFSGQWFRVITPRWASG